MATGKPQSKPLQTRSSSLERVVASPDGNWFATGGYYGPEVFAADAKLPPLYLSHTNFVTGFAFSPDSSMLLSVSWDQTARLWSIPDGQPLYQPLARMGIVQRDAMVRDAKYLVTGQVDGLVRVWQRPTDDVVIAKQSDWGQQPRLTSMGDWSSQASGMRRHLPVATRASIAFESWQPQTGSLREQIFRCPARWSIHAHHDNLAVAAVFSRGETGQLGVWDVATSRPRFSRSRACLRSSLRRRATRER